MSGMRFTDDMDRDAEIDRFARLLTVATDIYTTMTLSSGPPGMLIRQEDYERLEGVLAEFGNETAVELRSQRLRTGRGTVDADRDASASERDK